MYCLVHLAYMYILCAQFSRLVFLYSVHVYTYMHIEGLNIQPHLVFGYTMIGY